MVSSEIALICVLNQRRGRRGYNGFARSHVLEKLHGQALGRHTIDDKRNHADIKPLEVPRKVFVRTRAEEVNISDAIERLQGRSGFAESNLSNQNKGHVRIDIGDAS